MFSSEEHINALIVDFHPVILRSEPAEIANTDSALNLGPKRRFLPLSHRTMDGLGLDPVSVCTILQRQ